MNSLKRLEYCSGFTVEISAPACNTQRLIQVQLLGAHQEGAPGRDLGIAASGSILELDMTPPDCEGHLKKLLPCLRIARVPSSESQPQ